MGTPRSSGPGLGDGARTALRRARRPLRTARWLLQNRAAKTRRPDEFGPLGGPKPPLLFRDAKIVVGWSPKSACTHIVAWFLGHQGLLKAAEYYHPWVHVFRSRVYYDSRAYQEAAQAVLAANGTGSTLLRVTREPARRMVSIFRHTVRSADLWPLIHWRIGVDVGREGLSLVEFDRFLGGESIGPHGTSDIHFLVQSHASWDMEWDRIVTLNIDTHDLDAGLREIDREFGLETGAKRNRLHRFANARRYSKSARFEGNGPIETFRFRPSKSHAFPGDDLLASPYVLEMAHRHYGADIGRVSSADTAGRLFQVPPGEEGSRRSG